jgi:hypothetical protein
MHKNHITNNAPGQNIFFYNNHPIQFVSLVGIIVEEDVLAWGVVSNVVFVHK